MFLSYIDCVSYIALRQLYLPLASDIALYVRSCGGCGFLSLRHFVPPPSQIEAFRREQAHRPTSITLGAGFHHGVISSERSEDFIAERFHLKLQTTANSKWGRSKFCKMQGGDGANFATYTCKIIPPSPFRTVSFGCKYIHNCEHSEQYNFLLARNITASCVITQ